MKSTANLAITDIVGSVIKYLISINYYTFIIFVKMNFMGGFDLHKYFKYVLI